MKEEAFSIERVTTDDFEMTNLDNMTMRVYKGEIAGLLPVNEQGRRKLLEVMQYNIPLRYGRVYMEGRLVNSYLGNDRTANRVSVISSRNRLVPDLSVCDNIFVLRRGFKQYFLNQKLLNREARRVLEQTGLGISPDTAVDRLNEFERVVIELVRAIVQRARLIVFDEISTILSMQDILRLREMMHYYANQGTAFLYVGNHHEEIMRVCGRVMVMKNGRIIKNILDFSIPDMDVLKIAGAEAYPSLYSRLQHPQQTEAEPQEMHRGNAALEFRNVSSSYLKNLSFSVQPGECVVLLDRSMPLVGEYLKLFSDPGKCREGEILCGGRRVAGETVQQLLEDSIAVIQEYPHKSMIFPHLTFMENLCIMSDRKISSIFLQNRVRKSIRKEYAEVFGADIDAADMRTVSKQSKYSLVYYRFFMLRPKVAVCVSPFSGADLDLRQHILTLMQKLMERGIAVVILTAGLTDTYFVADRLLMLEKGRLVCEFPKEQFKDLWENLFKNQ